MLSDQKFAPFYFAHTANLVAENEGSFPVFTGVTSGIASVPTNVAVFLLRAGKIVVWTASGAQTTQPRQQNGRKGPEETENGM